ncbi:hypothetical protein Trydic_g4729 [Trypoxylus dichotomus]
MSKEEAIAYREKKAMMRKNEVEKKRRSRRADRDIKKTRSLVLTTHLQQVNRIKLNSKLYVICTSITLFAVIYNNAWNFSTVTLRITSDLYLESHPSTCRGVPNEEK